VSTHGTTAVRITIRRVDAPIPDHCATTAKPSWFEDGSKTNTAGEPLTGTHTICERKGIGLEGLSAGKYWMASEIFF